MIYEAAKHLGFEVVHSVMLDYAMALRTADDYELGPGKTTEEDYKVALRTIKSCEGFFDSEIPKLVSGTDGHDLARLVLDNYDDDHFLSLMKNADENGGKE